MRSASLLAAAIALCGVVLAAPPAPSPTITQAPAAVHTAAARGTPNCTSIQHYCSSCGSEDFDCETDPRCEWCSAHLWNSTTSTSTSTSSSSTSTV
ncbi:uncharacterized protein GGS22DRAFT_192246 [Annulohypoxylon maeteangense]|uniref:uncharacterized protein n=1 Tax=Annulohypoxylon maeteangense TaxID=1927788 RepID=UPI002007D996|nr:uncharacterized protein GGS22DRAFT_192246 [Annulohypoxylon maeteangense]KAI0881610.1 hypothetical protein GGS22DRAFT_192246 [Annulohypoxylon maeteangense]